jgi:hypothetical protein
MSAKSEEQLRNLLQGLAELVNSHLSDPAKGSPLSTVDLKETASSTGDTFESMPPDSDQPKLPEKTPPVQFVVRLPAHLHTQLLLLKDTLPNTSIQKIILAAVENDVRRLMKEHRAVMPRE